MINCCLCFVRMTTPYKSILPENCEFVNDNGMLYSSRMENTHPIFLSFKQVAKSKIFFCIVLIAVGLVLFFPRMQALPMENYDEGVYSEAALEMSRTGDLWTLSYQGTPFYEKPPLYIWASLPLVKIFGPENWTFRFWSAIAGIGSTILLGLFVFEKEKKMLIAWLASLIFMTGEFTILHAFRSGDTDGFLLFFSILGLYAYWKGITKKSWLLVAGAAFALAVMSKSVAGLAGPAIALIDAVLVRRWHMFKGRWIWLALLAFFAVAAPWHIAQTIMHGSVFWKSYIGFHVIDRSTSAIFPFTLPVYWYVEVVGNRLFLFSFLLPFAGILVAWRVIKKRSDGMLTLVWAIVPFVAYSLAVTKFEQYILICYPAIAWMIAIFVADIFERLWVRRLALAYALMLVVSIGILYCGVRNVRATQAKASISPYQEVAAVVREANSSRVVIYDTDLYTKPAGYFELAKLGSDVQIIFARTAEELEEQAIAGSSIVVSDETNPALLSAYDQKATVNHYVVLLAPKD